MNNKVIIAMWSGPRNISTAMMRAFENRPDTIVVDEPFYAHYLLKTGYNHPMRDEVINSQSSNWNKIAKRLTSQIPNDKDVWYQKHMAQHNLPNYSLDWTQNIFNCFLIRDPKEVIHSYSKKFELTSPEQIGFPQQLELFNKLKNLHQNSLPIVIDSKDILLNPKRMLNNLCTQLEIPFFDEMLNWPKGPRSTDGIWSKHWYKNVEASSCFNKYSPKIVELPKKYHSIYYECKSIYDELNCYKMDINHLDSVII